MKKNPNYTIIIPHYNSYKSLEELIKSIGDYEDIQIIIIDDNSTNEKYNLNKYKIEFYENNSKNKGAGACRNIGLKKAKGKWIIFADSDDFFLKDYKKKIDNYLESDKEIIYFFPTSIYEDTRLISRRHIPFKKLAYNFYKKNNSKTEKELRYKFVVPWSKIIKRELIERNLIEFDEVIASNDVMFSIKCGYYAKKIGVDSNEIYCVTTNKGSLTQRLNQEIFDARFNVSLNANKFLKKIGEKKQLRSLLNFVLTSRKLGIKKFFITLRISLKNGINIIEFFKYKIFYSDIKGYFKENKKKYFINEVRGK